MGNYEQEKANILYYLSRGKCPRCGGKNRVEPGRNLCVECRLGNNAQRVNTRTRRREAGLCTVCGKPRDDEKYLTCSACREKIRKRKGKKKAAYQKSWYSRMREEGRCVSCGKWAEPGRARCRACQKKSTDAAKIRDPDGIRKRELRQARIDAGLCIDCGSPVQPGKCRCKRCIERRRDSTRKYSIMQKIRREIQRGNNYDHA